MPVRSRKSSHARVKASGRRPGEARYGALIAARLDDLESSIGRVRSGRAKPRLHATPAGGRRVTLSTVADSLKSTDIHSIVEKAATATGRWQETANLVGLIGRNVKSLASPLTGGLKLGNPLSAIARRVGSMGGRAASSAGARAATAGGAAAGAGFPAAGAGGLDMGQLVNMARNVLGNLPARSAD